VCGRVRRQGGGRRGETRLRTGVQEADRADFLEPCGQDMLQEALDEGQGWERQGFPGLFPRFVAEGDRAVVHADEPPVGQGDPIDLGREVLQGGAAVADGLAVHPPILVPGRRGDLGEEGGGGCFQGVAERAAKGGRHLHVEKYHQIFPPAFATQAQRRGAEHTADTAWTDV